MTVFTRRRLADCGVRPPKSLVIVTVTPPLAAIVTPVVSAPGGVYDTEDPGGKVPVSCSTTVHTVPGAMPVIVDPAVRPPPPPKVTAMFVWTSSLQFTIAVKLVGSGVAGGNAGGMTAL